MKKLILTMGCHIPRVDSINIIMQVVKLRESNTPVDYGPGSLPISCDWRANPGNCRGRLLLVLFRISQKSLKNGGMKIFIFPIWVIYKFYSEWIFGVELSPRTKVGPGLSLPHPQCIVINHQSVIGKNCLIRHGVTIGVSRTGDRFAPKVGDNVELGCGAVLLGGIKVGNSAIVGANTVVVKDVSGHTIIAGASSRIIGEKS